MATTEKADASRIDRLDLERLGEKEGYRLDASTFKTGVELKVASDGHTVLIPQPTDHPNDPLTWSWKKKHITLFTITMISFLADFGSAIGIPSVIPQAIEWNLPQETVQHSLSGKINAWAGPTIVSPYIGPMFASFILTSASWRVAYWLYTALNVVALLLVVCFLDEPTFTRSLPAERRPGPVSRWKSLLGINQWQTRWTRTGLLSAFSRPFVVLTKMPLLIVLVYCYVYYAWLIGVNTTSAIWLTTIYKFTPVNLGCFYFAALVGVGIGQLGGHWMHDAVGAWWARRHDGVIEPEARLLLSYPSSLLMSVSLIVLGFALQRVWHYMVIAVFYAAQLTGIMVAITAVSAFMVDAFPEASLETGMWLIFIRTTGGFMASYIQLPWVEQNGAATVLGIQAALGAFTACLLVILQVFGKKIRLWQGLIKRNENEEIAVVDEAAK